MEIRTVEREECGGFLVNKNPDPETAGEVSVPDDISNRHRVEIQEWIDAGGVVQPFVGPSDTRLWELQMEYSDRTLPRFAEDILDSMADKSGVAQITLDNLQAKKDLRATKP